MRRILIANRGEIAVRIIRACDDYGVESVAVYADGDAESPHVRMADFAYALDGRTSTDTYLDAEKLLAVAKESGADAIHPGYGFLSESAAFARAVLEAGLMWIGPGPEAIELLGDKVEARKIAERVGAPLVPGTSDPVSGASEVIEFAREFGLPVAIKAAFGGGGRGLKIASTIEEIPELYESAVREAVSAFGRGECFVERYLERPRHVEVQVLADSKGTVIVVGDRDCSLQRRNQKLVEEAPAPNLSDEQRARIHNAARDICAEAGYCGAGTVEYLLSEDGTISFLEVNTRLQVEHPITEETSRIDLVLEQLRIADGGVLDPESEPVPTGHAFEFRINAEDPARGFMPSPGTVEAFVAPLGPGVRVDSGVESGSTVPGEFDSMLAKLIVTGVDREQALRRARRALDEFTVVGTPTVIPFHQAVARHQDFATADGFSVHTRWIETVFADELEAQGLSEPNKEPVLERYWVELDGKRVRLGIPRTLLGRAAVSAVEGDTSAEGSSADDTGNVVAPMAGTLVRWLADDGEEVKQGDAIAVLEAMKMETNATANRSGTLSHRVGPGDSLASGAVIAEIS